MSFELKRVLMKEWYIDFIVSLENSKQEHEKKILPRLLYILLPQLLTQKCKTHDKSCIYSNFRNHV